MYFSRPRRKSVSKHNGSKRGSHQARVERALEEREHWRAQREASRVWWLAQEEARAQAKANSAATPTPTAAPTTTAAPSTESFAETAAERYAVRRQAFIDRFGAAGLHLHRLAWLAHNCIAHPVLGLVPGEAAVHLHDRTADWLNLRETSSYSPTPAVRRPWRWRLHNCVAHPLIGIIPRAAPMRFHDVTAALMDEDSWL